MTKLKVRIDGVNATLQKMENQPNPRNFPIDFFRILDFDKSNAPDDHLLMIVSTDNPYVTVRYANRDRLVYPEAVWRYCGCERLHVEILEMT